MKAWSVGRGKLCMWRIVSVSAKLQSPKLFVGVLFDVHWAGGSERQSLTTRGDGRRNHLLCVAMMFV